MPKADVYGLRRPQKPIKEFTLRQEDWTAVLLLKRQGLMASTAHVERANEMYRKYVTGSGPMKDGVLDTKAASYVPPRPLPAIDGQPVEITYNTCQVAAAIELAQVAEEDERYTFEEICGMATVDEMAVILLEAYEWVLPQEDDGLGNQLTVLSSNTASDASTSTPS